MKKYFTFTFILASIVAGQVSASTLDQNAITIENGPLFDKQAISQLVDLENKQAIAIESISLDAIEIARLSALQVPVYVAQADTQPIEIKQEETKQSVAE